MRWMGLRLESDIKTSFFKVVLGGKEEWVSRGEKTQYLDYFWRITFSKFATFVTGKR